MATSALIGKLEPDNTVTYIRLHFDGYYSWAGRILQTFYSREHRVDALLSLGNISGLGPSPFNPSKGDDDQINCRAYIRDYKRKRSEESAIRGVTPEIFHTLDSYVYLFMEGRWHVPVDGEFRDIKGVSPYGILDQDGWKYPLSGLTVFRFESNKSYMNNAVVLKEVPTHELRTWDGILQRSESEKATYFIFRGTRLVSAVNPHYQYNPTQNQP